MEAGEGGLEQLLRTLSPDQRDRLLLNALRRDAELLEQAQAVAVGAAADQLQSTICTTAGAPIAFADLPAPALEMIAGFLYTSFCSPGRQAPPVSDVLATTRALRGTCQGWRRNINTARTVVALDLGPRSGQLWWDPTHGATVRSVRVQPVPPRVYPTTGPAAGMPLPQETVDDPTQNDMHLECRVVRSDASGKVRLEVCGSRRGKEPSSESVFPQVEVCDTGGGGGTVWIRGGVDLSRGEIPWHSCVPYPWPDITNVNPRPIYTIPLPPPEDLQRSFALLAHVSLVGLLLGRLPIALRSLPSLAVLELQRNLLRDLPTWLSQLQRLTTIDLTDSGLPASFLLSDQAMSGEAGMGLMPSSITDLRMGNMAGHDQFHDPYERMTRLPGWLGAATIDTFCSSLERLDLSDNQLDLRQVALPWERLLESETQQLHRGHASCSPCPWSSLTHLSLRGVRTNTIPHFLSGLHLTELDLHGLDVHDRGGGAIALPPADAAPGRDDGDVNDAELAYELAAAARDDAILGFMAHPTIANALSGIGGVDDENASGRVAPPTLCTLLEAILRPPLSLCLVRLNAVIMLDDAEAIEEEVVGSMGEPDSAVLDVLQRSFIDASSACAAGVCPHLQWVCLSDWHSIAMHEAAACGQSASGSVWVETGRKPGSPRTGTLAHRDYSRVAPGPLL